MYVDELNMAVNLVDTLQFYVEKNVPELMATALWACVILCRPLGGVEGQTLTSFARENFANVRLVAKSGGVKVMFKALELYKTHPLVLAKAFWLVVNFALVDEVKQYMIENGVIAYILGAMKQWSSNKEMQYRACFSLINLGIKPDAKRQIADEDGLSLVFLVMKRYSDDALIQRVGCNVIRSLIFGDTHHHFIPAIIDMGGIEVLQAAEERFQDNDDLFNVISQTIFWLDAF